MITAYRCGAIFAEKVNTKKVQQNCSDKFKVSENVGTKNLRQIANKLETQPKQFPFCDCDKNLHIENVTVRSSATSPAKSGPAVLKLTAMDANSGLDVATRVTASVFSANPGVDRARRVVAIRRSQ